MMPNHEQKIVWLSSLRISAFIGVAVVVSAAELTNNETGEKSAKNNLKFFLVIDSLKSE